MSDNNEPCGEEVGFDTCVEVLEDWFNSCNIQGVAEMETVELEELVAAMKEIEDV